MGPGYVVQFEGWVQASDAALQARGVLASDSQEMPNRIIAMMSYEGLSPENRRKLIDLPTPPVGTLRMW